MPKNCPKCDALMEHQQDDPSVGIVGCWVCTECDEVVEEEPHEDHDYED